MLFHKLSTLSLCAFLTASLGVGCASTDTTETPTPVPVVSEPLDTTPPLLGTPSPDLKPIYFDTDRALLLEDARTMLSEYAETLLDDPDGGVVAIEGHCDERGDEEYNLALGERRAAVVSQYLKNLGVPAARLRTVSRGEMEPAATGHTETAWRLNRRAEIHLDGDSLALR
jgi:peptidoglycan-associated lipoprotein